MEPRSRRPRPTPDTPPTSQWAPGEWWEWIAIFYAIAMLWPKILRWTHPAWDVCLWVAAVLMVVILVRRVRRTRRSWKGK